MEWSQWYLLNDKSRKYPTIRRYARIDGKTKWDRYPVDLYKELPVDEIEALVRRLNISADSVKKLHEKRYDIHNSFCGPKVVAEYESYLHSRANDPQHIQRMINYIKEYTIEFFILEKELPDPKHWPKIQHDWGTWLVEKKKLSHSSIKQIVFNTNRYLRFLHEVVRPNEMPMVKLEPLSRNKLKMIKLKTTDERYKFIPKEKFLEIEKYFKVHHKDLLSALRICYCMGLRISETLGLELSDVFEDSLNVERQGDSFPNGRIKTKPLKNLEKRDVPYWFANPEDVYEWIQEIRFMHPDTLDKKVNAALKGFGHETHDLRRSFVTRALREHHWRDVMRAAGHKDMETTLKYDQPITKVEKKLFKPKTL